MKEEFLTSTFAGFLLIAMTFWIIGQQCPDLTVNSLSCQVAAVHPEQPEFPRPTTDNLNLHAYINAPGTIGPTGPTGPAAPSPSAEA